MKNRLELFREQIAAFDGAADPVRAIAKGYVIEEPHHYSINALFKRISLRPQSKNLLIGGIGSGKTTQLLRLQQLFQEASDIGIYPHYVDITEYTKPNDVQVGTLDAIIGLELVKILKGKGLQVDGTREKLIQEFAYGSTITRDLTKLADPLVANQIALQSLQTSRVPGVLSSRPRSPDSSNRLAQVLSSLIKDFQAEFQQTPYFLFDGLDRVDEVEKVTRIASPNLQASKIGFLIVGAASLLYSSFIDSLDSIFSHIEYRSAFDVKKDREAYLFFRHVLFARSDKVFSQGAALRDLIVFSGGVLRDLINLAQESIQEAYLADAEIVDQQHVRKAVDSMGRAKILGLNQEQYEILTNFTKSTLIAPTSPSEIYLLSSGRILEYRFPSRRFDLHPVLKKLYGLKEQEDK
jgi:energy-coupling factor transporter ATP-binding protein EcfA2